MLAESISILCAITALACALLLLRAYQRTRTRLLLWSGLCFVGLAANNVLVFVDLFVIPEVSLVWLRTLVGILSLLVLIAGLVLDVPEGGHG